ncbi:hypothetical protein LPJ77_006267 [Coemansia sp. RSA 2523]|nr:hypothetical protein LPJ58_006168 [Coemansia sp. RSA 1591]KAJ1748219.1 hypothetical protein LPJ69_006157 [Coemansia sp. RSA 1752]KAJ1759388.1 hypothetical protein LPJ54_006251 [Coemansia sp. RSA 1824]KAJ1778739.1 hypothetical protein LPJ67_006039 [Coemansia sp. RSA 1938]KAJ1787631.1 hypothetical protein LPJ62_003274 [Coemansia sp. RSA 2167]KAJ1799658.1 hypothetical protein LPJ77_006267 [Coemansia sp. RSA 2523]KAJ2132466.1 hypothetical protein GGF48_000915 [Coemansia sp. RSA 921]KAJ2137482
MACECEHHHHHHHFCQTAIPPACWFLSHDRKEPCGCGGGSCETYHRLMSKLVISGFNPLEQEDVIFLRNLVVHEAGNAEKTVAMFEKYKSGYNAEWHYKT